MHKYAKKSVKLPHVPSKLIRLAVKDSKKTLEMGLDIEMSSWGMQNSVNERCSVCFAGAVMLQTCSKKLIFNDIGSIEHFYTVSFDDAYNGHNEMCFEFLDEIRKGHLYEAMAVLHIKCPDIYPTNNAYVKPNWRGSIEGWKEYSETTPEEFFKQCEKLADYLESHNL